MWQPGEEGGAVLPVMAGLGDQAIYGHSKLEKRCSADEKLVKDGRPFVW
jgi:hypothetical protein